MRRRSGKDPEAPEGPRLLPTMLRPALRRARPTPVFLLLTPVLGLVLLSLVDVALIVAARWELEATARQAARAIARDGAAPPEVAAGIRRTLDLDDSGLAVTVIDGPVVIVEVSRPTRGVSIFGFWRLVAPERLAMRGEARRVTPASEAGR